MSCKLNFKDPSAFLQKVIRAYWSKRQVKTNGSFQNHPQTNEEIIITWFYHNPLLYLKDSIKDIDLKEHMCQDRDSNPHSVDHKH